MHRYIDSFKVCDSVFKASYPVLSQLLNISRVRLKSWEETG